jgi:hypothetical protein
MTPLNAMIPLNYERLVADFSYDLLNNLRNHGTSEDCLETWVPDEDPVKSILNMVEAAHSADSQEIAVVVTRDTLPESRVPELCALLASLGHVEVKDAGSAWILTVGHMRGWDAFGHAAPALRAGLQSLFARLDHEGPARDSSGEMRAEEDGVSITLLPDCGDPPRVTGARHGGGRSPAERAVLEAVCRRIEGLPLDEAADHGVLRALHDVLDPAADGPVAGILRPEIADPAFGLATRLIREIERSFWARTQAPRPANFFEMPVSERWSGLSDAERIAGLNAVCGSLAGTCGLAAGQLQAVRIEPDLLGRHVRVTLAFDAAVPADVKPDLIREAERRIKRQLDPALYVLHEPLKDGNAIRRL